MSTTNLYPKTLTSGLQREWPLSLYAGLALLFGFTFLPWFSLYRTTETLLVVAFIWVTFFHAPTRPLRGAIARDPIFWLSLTLLFVLVSSQLWYHYSLPDSIEPSLKVTRHYIKPLMVLILALALTLGHKRLPWLLLTAATTGLIVYLLINTSAVEWMAAWRGRRVDFDIINAQHTAMLFGTLMIGLAAFGPRLFAVISRIHWSVAVLVLVALGGLVLFGVLATQSRAAWLGIGAATLVGLCAATMLLRCSPAPRGRALPLAVTLITGVLAVGFVAFDADDRIAKRLASEDISVSRLAAAGELTVDPTSSSTIRVASWSAAMEWIRERPLLGWGAGTTKELIQQSDYFSEHFKQRFGHLHNSFVESLVANGVTGTLLLALLATWVGIATVKGYLRGTVPGDVFIFAWAFFSFWFVVNLFESYILYPTGQYVNAVVVGFVYSFYLRSTLKEPNCG